MRTPPIIAGAALLAALCVGPRSLAAQEPADTTRPAPAVYVQEKNAGAAAVLEWAVPLAGFAYAGDWKRGVPSAAVRVAGTILFLQGWQISLFGGSTCESTCAFGAVLAVGGTLWSVIDAAATAGRTNRRIRAGASRVQTYPVVRGGAVGVGVAVSW